MNVFNNWRLLILLTLTLGLAPYYPEPHFFGKVKWILGGAQGMQLLDWFDAILHGFPFLLIIRLLIIKSLAKSKRS